MTIIIYHVEESKCKVYEVDLFDILKLFKFCFVTFSLHIFTVYINNLGLCFLWLGVPERKRNTKSLHEGNNFLFKRKTTLLRWITVKSQFSEKTIVSWKQPTGILAQFSMKSINT